MAIGVTDLFGLATPAIGYTTESSQRDSIEIVTIRDENGVTSCVSAKPLITREVSIKGKGEIIMDDLVAVTNSTEGDIELYMNKETQGLSEFPDFERAGKGYLALGLSSPTTPMSPEADPSGGGCPTLGITSSDITGITSFELTEQLDEADVVLEYDGTFDHQSYFDPTYDFSIRGNGDFPVILALGSDGGLPGTVPEFQTGVTIVTEISENQRNDNEPDWDASGQHFPGAA